MKSVVVGGADGFHQLLKFAVLDIQGTNVKLGFEIDPDVPVHRTKVCERVCAEAGQIT
jgi:sRNA-binding carbon storage regulator CsrA